MPQAPALTTTIRRNGFTLTIIKDVLTKTHYYDPSDGPAVDLDLSDYPQITAVGNEAFRDSDHLKSIRIPEVTDIGRRAFYYCSNLESIDIPKTTHIDREAFGYCDKITTVNLDQVTTVDDCAFNNCAELTGVSLPRVELIAANAFSYCRNLMWLQLPLADRREVLMKSLSPSLRLRVLDIPTTTAVLDKVRQLPAKSSTTSHDVDAQAIATDLGNLRHSDVTTINRDGFTLTIINGVLTKADYDELDNPSEGPEVDLDLSDYPQIIAVGDAAFYVCPQLKSIRIPSLIWIDPNAFRQCGALTSVYFPNVTWVDQEAFLECVVLTTVHLARATFVGPLAFSHCSALTEVSLPEVESVDTTAFDNSPNLTQLLLQAFIQLLPERVRDKVIDLPTTEIILNEAAQVQATCLTRFKDKDKQLLDAMATAVRALPFPLQPPKDAPQRWVDYEKGLNKVIHETIAMAHREVCLHNVAVARMLATHTLPPIMRDHPALALTMGRFLEINELPGNSQKLRMRLAEKLREVARPNADDLNPDWEAYIEQLKQCTNQFLKQHRLSATAKAASTIGFFQAPEETIAINKEIDPNKERHDPSPTSRKSS